MDKMSALILERKIYLPGTLGVWDWSDEDWKTPLNFPITKGMTYLFFASMSLRLDLAEKREISSFGTFGVRFDNPSQAMVKAVRTQNDRSAKLAEEVFNLFEDTMRRIESVLRTTAGLKELYWSHHESLSTFFNDSSMKVTWSYGKDSGVFNPKLKAGRRRLADPFKKKNLIDRLTWAKLQQAINNDEPLSEAVYELLRIRSRVVFRDRALPMIEAAIVTERTVRKFVLWTLAAQGMSKKRIKELKNDLTFSLNSNVFLPLCLTKTESNKMRKHIEGVNKLRKLRNDVAHSNIGYDDVTYDDAKDAVEAAIALVAFVERKLPSN